MRAVICVQQGRPGQGRVDPGASGPKVGRLQPDFDEAREHCEKQAAEHRYRYVRSGNKPALIAGMGTYTLEILEAADTEVIIVPVGGGSGAAGACVVAKAVRPSVQVMTSSPRPPAACRSWRGRSLVEDAAGTFAEGLATRTASSCRSRSCGAAGQLRAGVRQHAAVRDAGDRSRKRAIWSSRPRRPRWPQYWPEPSVAGRKVAIVCSGAT